MWLLWSSTELCLSAAGLLQRRFEQIFEYLNPIHGYLDLLAVRDMPEFATLSMEISEDVEGAALILCTKLGLCQGPVTAAVLQRHAATKRRLISLLVPHTLASQQHHLRPRTPKHSTRCILHQLALL